MVSTNASGSLNLGFLTILQEGGGHLGGYLVTNSWGRPLEFRLSSAVQPNRVQQILYGQTLEPYLCADLIGKTLVEKTATPVQLLLTDHRPVLDLRLRLELPVLWLAPADGSPPAAADPVRPARNGHGPLFCHPQFAGDVPGARAMLDRLDGTLDLTEPFVRIREAIGEARKMGVMNRG